MENKENVKNIEEVVESRVIASDTRNRQIPEHLKKSKAGRPKKYSYVTDDDGNVLGKVEIDNKRYWFVSFCFIHQGINRFSYQTFFTTKGEMWNQKFLEDLRGITPLHIISWQEFKNRDDYNMFNNIPKEEPIMGVLTPQVITGEY